MDRRRRRHHHDVAALTGGAPRCAVVGAGVMGAAAASALAAAGADVILFERFPLDHQRGSSHGATRLFRLAYFEHPDYVPLLRQAQSGWRALERKSGRTVMMRTGVVEIGPADSVLISGVRRAARDHNLALEQWSPQKCRRATPGLRVDPHWDILFEPDAGFLLAETARNAFLDHAQENGARIRAADPVTGLDQRSNHLMVRTPSGAFPVDRIVIAPGAFASPLLDDLELTSSIPTIRRIPKTLCWFQQKSPSYTLANKTAPFALQQEDGALFYGFPAIDSAGVKIGRHTDEGADEDAKAIKCFVDDRFSDWSATPAGSVQCRYEMSPDAAFIIDRHPSDTRILLTLGFSGHGFKFAPAIGDIIAGMAFDKPPDKAVEFLSLVRFSSA
ncbi:MAG: N-methyl-L-tryptophan oxidase [Pseudomonadota bacterium]